MHTFAVCSAFLLGDHLAFTANFQPNMILPLIIGKFTAEYLQWCGRLDRSSHGPAAGGAGPGRGHHRRDEYTEQAGRYVPTNRPAKRPARRGRITVGGKLVRDEARVSSRWRSRGNKHSLPPCRDGLQDVVLLEKGELTDGTTWHSAGLVGQLRPSKTLTEMNMHSVGLYRRLKEETGVDPGWREVGSLRLISSQDRPRSFTRSRAWRRLSDSLEILSTEEALELFPLFDPEGLRCAASTRPKVH